MENEFDVLGFDPSQLEVFNHTETPKTNFAANVYKPKPINSKSEDGIYRATIKPLYNPFSLKQSVLERQSYWLEDENGGFEVVSSLTNNDTNCPIFKAWKTCRYSKEDKLQAQISKDANLFNKRFARYITIQVIDDPNAPELNGKYMLWKVPSCIWEAIDNKMHPSAESKKAAIPILDFLFGKAIELEVKPGPGKPGDDRYSRETSYTTSEISEDVVTCTNPDGSPLLNDAQQEILDEYVDEIKKVWREKDPAKRAEMLNVLNSKDNTKELRTFYKAVIETIKGFCPNLVEELGYKDMTPEVRERVDKWIKIVVAGENPKIPSADSLSTGGTTVTTYTEVENNSTSAFEQDDDNLPF